MRILVVDDDAGSLTSVTRFLKTMGHKVAQCMTAKEALVTLRTADFAMVLTDIKMPEVSGLDLLQAVSCLPDRRPKVVLFTGHGSMESAIEALRMGAYDYLLKPVKVEELMGVIHKIELSEENDRLDKIQEGKSTKIDLGDSLELSDQSKLYVFSRKMRQVAVQALKYHTDRALPVLIQGETGTGKELIARLIHDGGRKVECPFIDLNCATIQTNLFESELFGYKAGSFTGGRGKDQMGKFDAAQGGTIFLDEIAEIPLEFQAKLLRVVQERKYYRVGGLEKIHADVRIICATNVNLIKAVEEGKFRRDLYYRLQVGSILIPPLRERREDILPLAASFLADFSYQKQKRFQRISKKAERVLLQNNWPGNVRELRNIIEWAVFMYDDEELQPHHLEKNTQSYDPDDDAARTLSEQGEGSLITKHIDQLVQEVLDEFGGNKAAAARYLGISRRSLYRLLEKQNA